jgi:hypothetical protein
MSMADPLVEAVASSSPAKPIARAIFGMRKPPWAIALLRGIIDQRPRAVTMRELDADGRTGLFATASMAIGAALLEAAV